MNKRILSVIISISLVVALTVSGCFGKPAPEPAAPAPAAPAPTAPAPEPAAPPEEVEPVIIGFIGAFDTDVGKSTMRGAELAIEEFNAAGGILGGRPIKYVKADSAEDVTEGIKAYEYLVEVEHVDFIISGSIDDVSIGWFGRMAEYRMPTIDTWTSAYKLVEKVRNDYEKYKMYFLNNANDWFFGVDMITFARDVLYEDMGWRTTVIFQEDTLYAAGVAEFVVAEIAPFADIEVIDHVVYDPYTMDFSPLYADMVATDPDFIYHISSVNSLPPTAQYVELQVPLPITGINVALFGVEVWEDTGGLVAGYSAMTPMPTLGMDLDPRSQAFVDKWAEKYTTRPVFPHFNGFNAYYGIYEAVEAAERVYQAGLGSGFEPLDAWVEEMLETDLVLYKDGEVWLVERFSRPGEVEPITGLEWPNNVVFDPTGEEGKLGVSVIQWYPDGTVRVVWPAKYATGEFMLPPWLE